MELLIYTDDIKSLLKKAIKGVKPTKLMPITKYFKFEIISDGVIVSSNTVDIFISYILECETIGVVGDFIYLDASLLYDLVMKTKSKQIKIMDMETHIEINGDGYYKFEKTTDVFPMEPTSDNIQFISLDLNALKDALKISLSSISTDNSILYMNGVYIDGDQITTTNNIKAIRQSFSTSFGDTPLLLGTQIIKLIQNVLIGDSIMFGYDADNSIVVFMDDLGTTLKAYELPDKNLYPDLNIVFNSLDGEITTKVNKMELINMLDRITSLLSSFENYAITMEVYKTKIKFYTNRIIEEIECQSIVEVSYIINSKALLDLLKVIQSDDIASISLNNKSMIQLKGDGMGMLLSGLSRDDQGEE